MAATNADDSMGGAVETPIAEENEISDIENDIGYPTQAKVDDARVAYPSWLIDTRNAESESPPHQVSTTADGGLIAHASRPSVKPLPRNLTQTRLRG